MVKFEEALKKIHGKTKRLPPVDLALEETIGRVLAENIRSEYDIPPFNKSAMDGYALRAGDLKSVPEKLKCAGVIKAGKSYGKTVKKGECIKIMTGAPVPGGADCVVMVEHTKQEKGRRVKFFTKLKKWENICFKGENIRKGTIVLKKGTVIRGTEVGIAASLGRKKLKVYGKPSLTVLNTGDEIVEPGNNLPDGKIYNSNGPMLLSLLRTMNIKTEYLGIAGDKEKSLKKSVMKGLKNDIFLLSGGVSMGVYDLVPGILKKCGVRKIFHKIYMKPGKPVFFGARGKKLVFGVPMGKSARLNIRQGKLKRDFRQKPGRKNFVPSKVLVRGIAALSGANAFMLVDGKLSFLKKNTRVNVILW